MRLNILATLLFVTVPLAVAPSTAPRSAASSTVMTAMVRPSLRF